VLTQRCASLLSLRPRYDIIVTHDERMAAGVRGAQRVGDETSDKEKPVALNSTPPPDELPPDPFPGDPFPGEPAPPAEPSPSIQPVGPPGSPSPLEPAPEEPIPSPVRPGVPGDPSEPEPEPV
jgi:hypothetical protein